MNLHSIFSHVGISTAVVALALTAGVQSADAQTLPDYQLRRLKALQTFAATPSDQIQPVHLAAKTQAAQWAGVRRIRIRQHQILSDCDYTHGGSRLGPGSPESAYTVLASDIADTYLAQATLKGIRIDSLGVSIHTERLTTEERERYNSGLFYTVYVKSPATDRQLEELRIATEKASPVFNLVANKVEVAHFIDYKQTDKKAARLQGLPEYLVHKQQSQAWSQAQRKAAGTATSPQPTTPSLDELSVEINPVSGVRQLHERYFNLQHDWGTEWAGTDVGPSALEHQLGILTSCVTHITLGQAANLKIQLDSLVVSVEADYDFRAAAATTGRKGFDNVPNRTTNLRYTFHIASPLPYAKIEELRDIVEQNCPMYKLYTNDNKVTGQVVRSEQADKYRKSPSSYDYDHVDY
jgi:uncharacterized OsmC-like protein